MDVRRDPRVPLCRHQLANRRIGAETVVLDEQGTWSPAAEAEAFENRELSSLDVENDEIHVSDVIDEELVQRPDRHSDGVRQDRARSCEASSMRRGELEVG